MKTVDQKLEGKTVLSVVSRRPGKMDLTAEPGTSAWRIAVKTASGLTGELKTSEKPDSTDEKM